MARIALVEGDEQSRAGLAAELAARGHGVLASSDLWEGLVELERAPPDLLLLDLDLPGALEAVAAIRGGHPPDDLPILGISQGDEERLLAGDTAGASDYLLRPVRPHELHARVTRLLAAARHAPGAATEPVLLPGGAERAFDRYRIVGVLGRGGFGTVYDALDLQEDRPVALKVLRPRACRDPDARQRFLREIYTLAAVRSPHVVRVTDYGSCQGVPFLAMERVVGLDLASHIALRGPLRPDELLAFLRPAAAALAALGRANLVHRDVKPANFILRGGRIDDPVLVDFGLAKHPFDRGVTSELTLIGSPGWLAPELFQRQRPDARSDLFSLGLVARFAATASDAYPGLTGTGLMKAMASTPVTVPAELPAPLRQVIARLTELDPDRRPGSALELVGTLELMEASLALAVPAFAASGRSSAREVGCTGGLGSRESRPSPTLQIASWSGAEKPAGGGCP